ncbi:MAG: ArgE/DapE family deacylase [Aerococcus urinaeequi]|uniref:ArgE/DapE family deacylase n=1 Tax=Aerococcus viridans TaxID=1377 RepID=UPI003B223207|nr:ArgE/DapE family deacylase [Aerococcus urinaeequi]
MISIEEKIEFLGELIAIDSVNGKEKQVAEHIQAFLKSRDIDSEVIDLGDGRADLVANYGSGKPVIGISGHMDVVAAGDPSAWDFDPFKMTEHEGNLYGRGTADMKAGVAAFIFALIEIKENNLLEKGSIRLMLTAAEESVQTGSAHFHENKYMDDVDALIIGEPTGNVINTANKGSMNFTIHSKGRAAHSSIPRVGVNAITPLLKFVLRIEEAMEEAIRNVEFSSFDFSDVIVNFGGVEGDEEGNKALNDFLRSTFLTNSMFTGGIQINSVPDTASASFNVRTVNEFDNEKVKALFNDVLAEFNEADFDLEMSLDLAPAITTGENDFVELAHKLGEDIVKKQFMVGPTTGVTDASNLLLSKDEDFKFIIMGPGQTSLAHQVNEHVSKDEYLNYIDLYIQLITQYANK